MNINKNQAIEIAEAWLLRELGDSLLVRSVFFIPARKAGGEDGYYNDQPARWFVSFQCDVPEGFYPDHADLEIDPETGEVEVLPVM